MDSFVVSARKYRPATFDTVVGQSSITNTLKNAIKNNHLAQAFLFTGPRGVGKTTCARIFAKTINCQNLGENMEPCDTCDSCVSFNSSSSFNVHELDAASNNSVEDIRKLVDQVRIPPQVGKYKIYIIDEVHMLSQAAFNAFLKTLEEPPAYAKFILATTEKHKIIPTILSRCQIYDFNRITVSDIKKHLEYVAAKEGVTAEEDALHAVALKADGALRDALSIFDQLVSFTGDNITYKSTIENLNVLDIENYFNMVDIFVNHDVTASLLLFDEIIYKGFDGLHFINGLAEHLRNLLVSKDVATIKLMDVTEVSKQRFTEQQAKCGIRFLVNALDICSQSDLNYKSASDKRLFVELALIKMCRLEMDDSIIESKKKIDPPTEKQTNVPTIQPVSTTIAKPSQIAEKPSTTSQNTPVTKPAQVPDKVAINELAKDETPKTPINLDQKATIFGFSVTDALKVEGVAEKEVINYADELNKTHDRIDNLIPETQFRIAIAQYASSIKTEKRSFYTELTDERIEILENNTIVLTLSNSAIVDDETRFTFLSELKRILNNSQINLKIIVKEEVVVKKDDNMETYKMMVDKNPFIDEMRKQLGLDFS